MTFIRWLKEADLEHPSLKHVKHVRKWIDSETCSCAASSVFCFHHVDNHLASRTSLLLTPADRPAPVVPGGLEPYIIAVPRFPARTMDQVRLKATIWPVFYEVQNHRKLQEESRRWTRATVQWFCDAVTVLKKEAKRVRLLGEACPLVYLVLYLHVRLTLTRRFQSYRMCQHHLTHLLGRDHLLRMTCVCPPNIHSGMPYSTSFVLWEIRCFYPHHQATS